MQRMSCYSYNAALCAILLGISHQLNIIFKFESGLGVIFPGDKVHNERVLNGEDGVVVQVLVLTVEDLGSKRAVAFLSSLCGEISLRTSFKMQR